MQADGSRVSTVVTLFSYMSRFVENLKLHAKTEEEILYPTAILIGDYLKMKLADK